jgi:hypothetical protein
MGAVTSGFQHRSRPSQREAKGKRVVDSNLERFLRAFGSMRKVEEAVIVSIGKESRVGEVGRIEWNGVNCCR